MAAAAAAGALAVAFGAAEAGAGHWPQLGGDSGRSGNQTSAPGVLPARQLFHQPADAVHGSIVNTAGPTAFEQRLAYGFRQPASPTEPDSPDGVVRIRRLLDGASVAALDIDDEIAGDSTATTSDSDTFGEYNATTNPYGPQVTPVDSSTGAAPRDLYVIHNDDNNPGSATNPNTQSNDIGIAQIALPAGTLVQDVQVGTAPPGGGITSGYTIFSAPLITDDLTSTGDREIYFIAHNATANETRLFQVRVTNGAPGAADTLMFARSTAITNANRFASPALGRFKDPDSGIVVDYVIVPTNLGISTVRRANINDTGPKNDGLGVAYTPALPVRSGDATDVTPHFYVAHGTGSATVSKLRQDDATGQFVLAGTSSAARVNLAGEPAPALALDQRGTDPGRVVVSTERNVYSLNTENLSATPARLLAVDQTGPGGFQKTIPAVANGLGFITSGAGVQYVFRTSDMQRAAVSPTTGFVPFESSLDSTSSQGQPSISRGIFQFGSDNGVFAYATTESPVVPPAVALTAPAEGERVGSVPSKGSTTATATATDDRAVQAVAFTVDSTAAGEDTTPADDGRTYTTTIDWTKFSEGEHTVTATGQDVSGNRASSSRKVIVDNVADPTAAYTIAPAPPQPTGTEFTFDGKDSRSNASGQSIQEYRWDFGDGRTATGQQVKHAFAKSGTYTVRLTVRDAGGESSTTKSVQVTNRAPAAAFQSGPNPATTGQTVSFDASSSKDPDGSVVKYEWDLDGNGTFEVVNTGPRTERSYDTPGTYNIGLRVTDDEGGTSSTSGQLTVNRGPGGPNQSPTAAFTATPNPTTTNRAVTYDASASRDTDGTIAKYEWDLDGNGSFETDTGATPRATRTYSVPEVVNVRLRVTDDGGASALAVRQVIVQAAGPSCGGNAPRCRARVSYRISPGADTRRPYRFRATGRIIPPAGLDRGDACQGRVTLQVKRGQTTISTQRRRLGRNCRFLITAVFRDAERFGKATRLRFVVVFQGNKVLNPNRASVKRARIKR